MTTPAKEVVETPRDPLADWQLAGVSEVPDGYLVTLSHRQKAGDSLIIRPSGVQVIGKSVAPAGELKVEGVDLAAGDWKKTVVRLNTNGQSAEVRFPDPLPAPATRAAAASEPKRDRSVPTTQQPAYPHKQSPAPAR